MRFRLRGLTKDGRQLWMDNYGVRVEWESEPATLSFLTDISQLVRAEEQRSQYEAQLRQAQKLEAIGTLAGGIAHDFNNILTGVMGYADLLRIKLGHSEEQSGYVDQVLEGCARARDLIKQILTFSRQTEKEHRPVQAGLMVNEALKLLRASLPATVEIKADIASSSMVMGDPSCVHQVIMNLSTNASHAMRAGGGVLAVSLHDLTISPQQAHLHPGLTPGPYLRLKVSDTGHGMTSGVLERVFEPFFTTKEREEGTGMGLAVTHGIVKSMGGVIEASSQPGQGSAFEVLLPTVEGEAQTEAQKESPLYRGSGTVLLVDDEIPVLDIMAHMMEAMGLTGVMARDGQEALELIDQDPRAFDLVITDLTMPRMTGDKLAQQIKSRGLNLPVILAPGFSRKFSQQRLDDLGIRAQLFKPILLRQLSETIEEVLTPREREGRERG